MHKYSIFIELVDPTGKSDYISNLVHFESFIKPEDMTFDDVEKWFKHNTDYFENIYLFGNLYKGHIEYIPYIEGH